MSETASETKIIRIIVDSSKAIDGSSAATRALQKVEQQTASMDATLAKVEKSLASIGGMLMANLALALAAVSAHILDVGRKAFEAAAGLDEMAEQIGINARELQGLQFAAVQGGVKLEQLETGVAKFSKKLGDAANGNKEMIESLERLNVKILDSNGKMRPTSDSMSDVAASILKIEEPAKRAAAMVEWFGKSGQKMTTVLGDMAKGLGEAANDAERFGAMVRPETIKRLDDLSDAMARHALRSRAFYANMMGDFLEWTEKSGLNDLGTKFLKAHADFAKGIGPFFEDVTDFTRKAFDESVIFGAKFAASFIEVFRAVPSQLGKLFTDAINGILARLESGLPLITGALEKHAPWLGVKTATIDLGRLDGGGASGAATLNQIIGAGNAAEANLRAAGWGRDYAGEREQQRNYAALGAIQARGAARPGMAPPSVGTSNPGVKGEGQSEAERYKKLLATLNAAAEAQDKMTEAAGRGDVAFIELQAHLEAQTKVLDIYGGKLDATAPKIKKQVEEVERILLATKESKARETFILGTTEIAKQNELLEAQNRLMEQAPHVQAAELALIKATQEARKAGKTLTASEFEERRREIEQGELLKKQSEELKQSAERWSTPFKNAFQAIQQAGADAWEAILKGGKLSFESVTEVARVSLRRVAAELINLATIRPLIGFGAQALGSIGILSPASVSSMGFGGSILGGVATGAAAGTASGVAAGAASGGSAISPGLLTGVGTGFSLSGLFGGGSPGGGLFGGIGSWLNTPIMPPIQGPLLPGAPALGQGLGGITPLGAIGGLASMGFGAYNLFTSKTPLGMLGGGMGLIGGGLGLAAGAGLIGSAFGPIGTAVGLLGGLLGLFGGSAEPPIPPQPALDLSIGSFVPNGGRGFTASGYGMNGGGSLGTQAGTLGTTVSRLFRSADVSPIAGATYGGRIWSGVDHVLNGRTWADRPYTQTALLTPGGDQEFVTYNDGTRGLQAAADLLIAAVFKANVLRGGVSDVSPALRAGVTAYDPTTAKDVQTVIGLAGAYDKLGKVAGTAKEALDKISASFDDLADFADRAGLSMQPINAEIEKQSKRWAQDFIDNMLDPLALQLRALADEKDSALASAQYIRDHVAGVYVDMDKTVAYFTDKEAKLRDQFYGGAVESLQQAIDALSLGPLANLSPATQLAALKSNYDTTLAQARANDPDAIARLAGVGTDFANSLHQNYASGSVYEAYRQQILADLREMQAAIQTPSSSTNQPLDVNNPANQATNRQFQQLMALVEDLTRRLDAQAAKQGQTNDLLQRLATNVK